MMMMMMMTMVWAVLNNESPRFSLEQTLFKCVIIIIIIIIIIEQFSIECRKTKTKPITYQLDYSANLKLQ